MAESFDVKNYSILLTGSAGTAFVPLYHVPTSGGCITLLEAYVVNGTIGVPGTVNLLRGTAAANGTFVPLATIGTSYGTGGGTFAALAPVALTISSPVLLAGDWLAIACSGTFNTDAQSYVTLSYVQGRAYGA
jgi:hypothetical protein